MNDLVRPSLVMVPSPDPAAHPAGAGGDHADVVARSANCRRYFWLRDGSCLPPRTGGTPGCDERAGAYGSGMSVQSTIRCPRVPRSWSGGIGGCHSKEENMGRSDPRERKFLNYESSMRNGGDVMLEARSLRLSRRSGMKVARQRCGNSDRGSRSPADRTPRSPLRPHTVNRPPSLMRT